MLSSGENFPKNSNDQFSPNYQSILPRSFSSQKFTIELSLNNPEILGISRVEVGDFLTTRNPRSQVIIQIPNLQIPIHTPSNEAIPIHTPSNEAIPIHTPSNEAIPDFSTVSKLNSDSHENNNDKNELKNISNQISQLSDDIKILIKKVSDLEKKLLED